MATQTARTAQKWYQTKRVPLYAIVGGTVASAATYLLFNRAQHPQVESHKGTRQNEMHEVEPGSPMTEHVNEKGAGHGATSQTSSMRGGLRAVGLMDGQRTDGILPNDAIANKMRDIVGHEHKEHEEILSKAKGK